MQRGVRFLLQEADAGDTEKMLALAKLYDCWSTDAVLNAAHRGHTQTMLAAMQYGRRFEAAAAERCPADRRVSATEAESSTGWIKGVTRAAASGGHVETMLTAVREGCPWDPDTTAAAAIHGRTEAMLVAVQHGCPWSPNTLELAAMNGHAETLRVAVANGCPRQAGARLTKQAAMRGHTEAMLAAVECGFEWDPEVTVVAVKLGYFDTLQAAVENGCKWGKGTITCALQTNDPTLTLCKVLKAGYPPSKLRSTRILTNIAATIYRNRRWLASDDWSDESLSDGD